MTKVHVVIPHWNHWNLTHSRLWEIYKHEKDTVSTVLVVDDCSTDTMTEDGLKWWADFRVKNNFNVECLQLENNVGFLLASNAGLEYTVDKCDPDDIVVLLSNDVQIMTPFASQMTEILSQPKKMVGGILYTHDTGWNRFGDKVYPYLEGWLMALTANSWKTFGYLDERYVPNDFEDVDTSTLALSLGYELVPLNNPGLHHMGAQSIGYNEKRQKLTETNRKKFEDKWITQK